MSQCCRNEVRDNRTGGGKAIGVEGRGHGTCALIEVESSGSEGGAEITKHQKGKGGKGGTRDLGLRWHSHGI